MNSGGRVLVANAGTIYVFQTASQLQRHGLLKRCATSLYFKDKTLHRLPDPLRGKVMQWTLNRRCAELNGSVMTLPWPEMAYLAATKLGVSSTTSLIEWRNRTFGHWAAKHCLDDVELVWANDTSGYELFVEAKRLGLRRVLDMSIAHPALGHRLMAAYAEKRPNLAACLDLSAPDEAMERRRAEIDLADHIVVGSSFVRDSLLGERVDPAKITVNPYGVSVEKFRPRVRSTEAPERLRFLFVGWFSARKGIYDLLDAWALSNLAASGAELLLVGGTRDDLTCWHGDLPAGVACAGRVSHDAVPELYRSADVFVFPSLFEGSARVVLEAGASGLPVITTPESCDEQWVIDGENGFRVAAGEPATLADRMRALADDLPRRAAMGARAIELAGRFTWSAYGDRCAAVCQRLLNSSRN